MSQYMNILQELILGNSIIVHNDSKAIHKVLGVVLLVLGIAFLSLNQNPNIHNHH